MAASTFDGKELSVRRTIIVLMAAAFVSAPVKMWAQDARPPSGVEPRADEILRQMGRCLADAQQFSFVAHDMIDETLPTGQKIQLSNIRRLKVRRPDRIQAELVGDTENERAWYAGTKLTFYSPERNVYSIIDVPDNIDEMLDYIVANYGMTVPVADFLFSDPYRMAMEKVRSGRYLGVHHVMGVKCHHLAFRQEGLDWQIWIDAGKLAVPRKLVITYKEMPDHPQYVLFIGEWDLSANHADELFVFEAPKDAKQEDMQSRQAATGADTAAGTDATSSEKP